MSKKCRESKRITKPNSQNLKDQKRKGLLARRGPNLIGTKMISLYKLKLHKCLKHFLKNLANSNLLKDYKS